MVSSLQWLCHADARQVSDLPKAHRHFLAVSDRYEAVTDRKFKKALPGKS
jgi:hypothetical protein